MLNSIVKFHHVVLVVKLQLKMDWDIVSKMFTSDQLESDDDDDDDDDGFNDGDEAKDTKKDKARIPVTWRSESGSVVHTFPQN